MAGRSIGDIIRLVCGTNDATSTGTKSTWKVVAGVGSVVATATDTLLGDIKAAVQAPVAAQGDAAAKFDVVGMEIEDPASLPAAGLAGKVRRLLGDLNAILLMRPMLPVAGAAPSPVVGTTGRIPQDYSFTIAAGKTITIHPLQSGVSVIIATGGAASAAAAGKVVTLTDKNDDSTTVAAMQALIAAGTAAPCLTITGTAGDTFDHTKTLAQTALWVAGTVGACARMELDGEGNVVPAQRYTGAQYVSAGAESCASLKATPGYVNSGCVYNDGDALAYLQFHDLAAAPGGGATPKAVLGAIVAGDTVPWPSCVRGAVGLQVALSSTRDTYTAYAHMHALLWTD